MIAASNHVYQRYLFHGGTRELNNKNRQISVAHNFFSLAAKPSIIAHKDILNVLNGKG